MKQTEQQCAFHANDNFDVRQKSSKHASKNYQRRGIKDEYTDAVMLHADFFANRGGGLTLWQISKKKLRRMGGQTPEGVQTDRLRNLVLLVANDNTIVTAIRPSKGKYKLRRTLER